MDVLACGSLARREYTLGSDIDWLVVVNAMPEHPAAARNLVVRVKECVSKEAAKEGSGAKDPGTSGLFGRATGLFDIIERVGLQDDTNQTHSMRMEIVHESVSLLDPQLHARILERTIGRYLSLSEVRQDTPPRFLLNDMLRYWRQITVDYQAKAPLGVHDPKAVLRYLKLLTTRKNVFASSILPLIAPRDSSVDWQTYLNEVYTLPPLARLATVTESAPPFVHEAVRTVFSTVDLFVQLTGDEDRRKHFGDLTRDSRNCDASYVQLKTAAARLQEAYESIFLGDWSEVAQNTRHYLLL